MVSAVTSITTSAPSPRVNSRTRATTSSSAKMVASAPNSSASLRRRALWRRAITATCAAPGFARGGRTGDAALARAEDHDGIAHVGAGHAMGPTDSSRNRLIERGQFGGNVGRDLVQRDLGIEVHEFRHAAP